jgi:glutamate-ammonia-ligase adenylyltransferase
MAAAERYYETWGRLWERAALLRARPIATAGAFGAQLMRELVVPFVFRREVDPSIATLLAELIQRSRAEIGGNPELDLKHGPGGIREAEFFAQSLQLIWGGREPSLHVQGTLAALFRLRSRGLATDREVRVIAGAYRLLRRVEHRIQWMTGVQTHLLPEAGSDLDRLARSLEYAGGAELVKELTLRRNGVEELFRSLAPEAPRPLPRHHALLVQLEQRDAALADSTERAFGSAEVAEHLRALGRRPDALLGSLTRERHPDLADAVLDALSESPDPEQSARFLRSFLGRFSTPAPYVKLLVENPTALPRLVWVFGASVFVGEASVRRPELADVMLFGHDTVPDARTAVATELGAITDSASDDPYDRQERLIQALRRAKHRVMVEVAVADLAGVIDTREATRTLSTLADETLERVVSFVVTGDSSGQTRGLCVLAVGKLGGCEIGYGSDLDILFIYDPDAAPDGVDPGEHFVRAAQRVIRLISEPHAAGAGYELDTRLRPSGSHGMLVTSLASFSRYHGSQKSEAVAGGPSVQSSGAAWERQALIRARACAGDRALATRAIAVATQAAYEGGAPPADEVQHLRTRMEQELARERPGRYDLKTGRGGLLDIEFATQWLQMKHGRDPRIRTPDTSQALEALAACGYLDRRDFETFREAYSFLRRLEQRIHVLHATSATGIDARAPGLTQLARRLGMHDTPQRTGTEELLDRYRDVTEAVRGSYERVLGLGR